MLTTNQWDFASPGANKRFTANMCSPKELMVSSRPSKYLPKISVKVSLHLQTPETLFGVVDIGVCSHLLGGYLEQGKISMKSPLDSLDYHLVPLIPIK